jgi:uncharacterized protein
VLRELEAFAPVVAVFGNMDEPALKEALPRERIVTVEEARIGLVHIPGPAAGREERLLSRFAGCDAVVYGHTHVPQADRAGAGWVLNPGSPTERRRAATRSMLLLGVEGKTLRPRLVPLP